MTVKSSELLKEKYYMFKHKSGLDVYVFPKKMTTSYALFATRYGAVDNKFKLENESEFTTVPDGIAHFLEHKMFEDENGEDAFTRYARLGASANAYTSNNMTAYLFSCTENFYESLEILLDFVTHPYFTDENVKKEQGIIGQEIRMY
ncbi:MAG: insulinase family protein, partial [Clostridia bacterium]|nr:insulinase family protein [Clostridia bacterium]